MQRKKRASRNVQDMVTRKLTLTSFIMANDVQSFSVLSKLEVSSRNSNPGLLKFENRI